MFCFDLQIGFVSALSMGINFAAILFPLMKGNLEKQK